MNQSPLITSLSWGHLEVEGQGRFRDAKIYPGGARAWNWNETGTHHSPGVQFTDVEELLQHGSEVVILSKGMNQRLKIQSVTLQKLEERGVLTHVLQTEEAVRLYNQLAEKEKVGALIHSTC
ncbi:MAG: Mth938-like domain-containing protein [Anaerolineales bacterium]|jgi:hypothetical protein